MLVNEMILDAFARNAEAVGPLLEGLSAEQILWRPDAEANSIGWLVWHLARVEDDHMAGLSGREQRWPQWRERFGLPYEPDAIGYAMSTADVARFDVGDADLLRGYYAAVHDHTVDIVGSLGEDDFARIVDENWDPPVTLAVRVVSVINDTAQHLGQAAYVRGLIERRAS